MIFFLYILFCVITVYCVHCFYVFSMYFIGVSGLRVLPLLINGNYDDDDDDDDIRPIIGLQSENFLIALAARLKG